MQRAQTAAILLIAFLILFESVRAESTINRIAVLGCIRQEQVVPALMNYVRAEPDLLLWVGDNVYADTENDIGFIAQSYQKLARKPGFKPLLESTPYLATWDDHDFGRNDGGADYPLKRESQKLFVNFWGLESTIPDDQEGIYYSQLFETPGGRLQVIMLDVRYHRQQPGPQNDILGAEQWEWLQGELQRAADLRLIVSGFQVLLDPDTGSETWTLFPSARERLFQTIRTAGAERVVFVTGDQHYGEAARLRNALDYDAIELQFAGLNQTEKPERNRQRVSPASQSLHSYALMDLQWTESATDIPHLAFRVFDAQTDRQEFSYRVNFSEIELHIDAPTSQAFINPLIVPLRMNYTELDLRYTTDGTTPNSSSPTYDAPLKITETTTLQFQLFNHSGAPRGKPHRRHYTKAEPIPAAKVSQPRPGVFYEYYEGHFTELPEFNQLQPLATGITETVTLNQIPTREDHFAIEFTGYFLAPKTDVYTFGLTSGDGAKLFLSNQTLIDNDGSHSAQRKVGTLALSEGHHQLRVEYFEDYLGQQLQLTVQTPTQPETIVPTTQLFHTQTPTQ